MNPATFDIKKASAIENAVCGEFKCTLHDIGKFQDTLFKKVVVFILVNWLEYDKRIVGHQYQMTYLYVPTVIVEIENFRLANSIFNEKINSIYKKTMYAEVLE